MYNINALPNIYTNRRSMKGLLGRAQATSAEFLGREA